MFNLIRVELKDGTICRMVPRALKIFLSLDKIARFERSGGWVVVGVDPLRCKKADKNYSGVDQRLVV
jgi:hypothetical protein